MATPLRNPFRRASAARARTHASSNNRVRLLHNGRAAFPAMLAAIESAEREVLVEMYWFASDATGRRFAEALSARARDGVDVRVCYDAVGSLEADGAMFDRMRTAGCKVHEYHPLAPWRANFQMRHLNRRDHRKMIVVDGRIGIAGGINFGDAWAPIEEGGDDFRDEAIQVEGPAAAEMRQLFFRAFPGAPPALPNNPSAPPFQGDCRVSVLASDLRGERRGIRQEYLKAISSAQRDIVICNSYFLPDRRTRRALFRARERGVRVRVLMPRDSDVSAVKYASQALYPRMMRKGIELYEWEQGILHAKTAVVDGSWCTVGSFNFDARSVLYNLEMNMAVHGPQVACALRASLESDLALSGRVDPHNFAYRPLGERALERFCYSFRWLL